MGEPGNGTITADVCVIGAGSGGLTVAAGASQMGAATVLIERGRMGGDCLNYGCVPSKALLAAARQAQAMREARRFGIAAVEPAVDFAAVMDHVRQVIDGIAPHDSVARFTGLGVRVLQAEARFTGRDRVLAGGVEVRARRFVVATGSRPVAPPVPGLDQVPFLTNETVFDNRVLPDHLIVLGGGPIGLELAQAHRRLGAAVTVLEMGRPLGRDDPELAELVVQRLSAEGIRVLAGVKVAAVARRNGAVAVDVDGPAGRATLTGSHLLVAAGRRPNIEALDLAAAGIEHSPKGIIVDSRLRTSNRRVHAIGDVAGGLQFTHVAGYHGGIVLRNILFRLPARADHGAVPWVTYTDPELAQVGLQEAAARERHGTIRILRAAYADNDRARTEREPHGMIKVIADRRGRILGAGIVGPQAGELILPWVLAVGRRLRVGTMAGLVAPYPTLSEIGKRAAGSYFAPTLFSPRTRRLVRFLARFG